MKRVWLFSLLLLSLVACQRPTAREGVPLDEQPQMAAASVAATDLFEVPLPAGNVEGWSIDFPNWSGHERKYRSVDWLRDGDADGEPDHTGVVFIGAGKGLTHIRPPNLAEACILVGRHNGVVRITGATIHCGKSQGIFFGLETPGVAVQPNFRLELFDSEIVSDAPAGTTLGPGTTAAAQTTTKWGVFSYQADVYLRDVTIDLRYSAEHGQYSHGFARDGVLWDRVFVRSTGAEQLKLTARPWECAWVGTAKAVVRDSVFQDWYQPWSWRGGGGIVVQGAGIDLAVLRSLFKNPGDSGNIPSTQRTRCIMIDDSADNNGDGVRDFYNAYALPGIPAGTPGQGFANGKIRIRECGFYAGPGADSLSILIRVGKLGVGPWQCARSFQMSASAAYGNRVQLQLRDCPPGEIRVFDCNTIAIAEAARRAGIRVSTGEAVIPTATRVIPVSEGYVR